MSISVTQVAEQLGIAKSTVSLVLNNKRGVSPTMRRRVLDAVRQMGGRVPTAAVAENRRPGPQRPPAEEQSRPLSLLVLHPSFFAPNRRLLLGWLQGIQDAVQAEEAQLHVVSHDAESNADNVADMYLSEPDLRPDGILIIGARDNEPLVEEAQRRNIPFVLVGRQVTSPYIFAVGRDEADMAYQATRYLLDLGHMVIGFAGGRIEGFGYPKDRLRGYQQALREHGIEPMERWTSLHTGRAATEAVLEGAPELTAILFINDFYALNIGIPVLHEAGKRIPEDISVIGFGNSIQGEGADPPLTSVAYSCYEEGRWAVKLLLDRMRSPALLGTQMIFRTMLVKRESCAPPRSAK